MQVPGQNEVLEDEVCLQISFIPWMRFSEESRTGCRNRLKRFRAPVVSGFPADEMTIMTYTIARPNDGAEKAVYRQMMHEKWKRCVERGDALPA